MKGIFGLYSEWINLSAIKVIYSVVFSVILLNLLAMGLIYLTDNFAMPRSVSLLTPILELMTLMAARLGIWYFFHKTHSARKVLIIGADAEESMAFAKKFIGYAKGRFSLSGFVHGKDPKEIEAEINSLNVDIVAISSQLAQRGKIVDYCIKKRKEILTIPAFFNPFQNIHPLNLSYRCNM